MEINVGDQVVRVSDGVIGIVVAVGVVDVDVLFNDETTSQVILKSKVRKL